MKKHGVKCRRGRRAELRLALAVVLGAPFLLAFSARAHGKESKAVELATARGLFAEATALEARSDFGLAATKLKSAIAIKETPGLHYHLAHCEEQLGQFVTASQDYERAQELIRNGVVAPDVEPLLPPARHRLELHIVKLGLVVPAGTSAVAELDGRPLAPFATSTSVRLDPGAHRVVVRAPGHSDYRAELTLAAGEHRTLKVFFEQPAASKTAPPPVGPAPPGSPGDGRSAELVDTRTSNPDSGSGGSWREGLLIGEAAVTLAGLGVGVGSAIVRYRTGKTIRDYQDDIDTNAADPKEPCSDPIVQEDCAALGDATHRANTAVTLERAGFITAGAAAGLLLATWLFWPSSSTKPAVALAPRPDGVVLFAAGSF